MRYIIVFILHSFVTPFLVHDSQQPSRPSLYLYLYLYSLPLLS